MEQTWLQTLLGWWLIATLVLITAVDAIALATGHSDDTVSRWCYDMGQSHPWLYLVVGITLGHILFPLLVTNGVHR